MKTEALEKGTGRVWSEWLAYFESIGAADLDHPEIARRLAADHPDLTGWWGQAVVIHYEQQTGRRAVGETSQGVAANASRTVPGDKDAALAAWESAVGGLTEHDGVPVERAGASSATEKWRYWRCTLVDGSKVQVTVSDKAAGKVVVAVQHTGLDSVGARDGWRAYWKSRLTEL